MGSYMYNFSTYIREFLVAMLTMISFISCVNPFMRFFITCLRETFVAILTLIWFFFSMNPFMNSFILSLCEGLIAIFALMWHDDYLDLTFSSVTSQSLVLFVQMYPLPPAPFSSCMKFLDSGLWMWKQTFGSGIIETYHQIIYHKMTCRNNQQQQYSANPFEWGFDSKVDISSSLCYDDLVMFASFEITFQTWTKKPMFTIPFLVNNIDHDWYEMCAAMHEWAHPTFMSVSLIVDT